jgi:hypothetical protein
MLKRKDDQMMDANRFRIEHDYKNIEILERFFEAFEELKEDVKKTVHAEPSLWLGMGPPPTGIWHFGVHLDDADPVGYWDLVEVMIAAISSSPFQDGYSRSTLEGAKADLQRVIEEIDALLAEE